MNSSGWTKSYENNLETELEIIGTELESENKNSSGMGAQGVRWTPGRKIQLSPYR